MRVQTYHILVVVSKNRRVSRELDGSGFKIDEERHIVTNSVFRQAFNMNFHDDDNIGGVLVVVEVAILMVGWGQACCVRGKTMKMMTMIIKNPFPLRSFGVESSSL